MKSTELGQMTHDYALGLPVRMGYFAAEKDQAAEDCRQRILASAAKYEVNPDLQSFETAQIGTMVLGLREELLDVINYAAMITHLCQKDDSANARLIEVYVNEVAKDALVGLILTQSRITAMIEAGEFTPNPGETYVEQLSGDSGVDHAAG